MKKYLFIFSILLISCEEEITLNLSQAENTLVVEGSIEPGFPPYVILTKNQGYFDPINQDTYNSLFVNDVDSVKVWHYNESGEKEIVVLERFELSDSLPPIYTDFNYFNSPKTYSFSQSGRTYYLEIQWNNQIITSETAIPEPTPLDSIWVEQSENSNKDFECDIRAIYSDPSNIQNNILIRSKRIQHYEIDTIECVSQENSDLTLKLVDAGSDVLINGQTFETYFPRPKENGFPTGKYNSSHTKKCNGTPINLPADTVLIKFCQIDEPSMKFWRSLVRQFGTNGNPFAEPMNLVSNINNGLGVWTGYGPVYYKIPIVKDTIIKKQYSPKITDIF